MIECGAHGCVHKESPPGALVDGIERVAGGEACFAPDHAMSFVRAHVFGDSLRRAGTEPRLSRRESEVLGLIATGMANKEMAACLGVGVRTVETHRERLKAKLGIRTVAWLTRFALTRSAVGAS